MFFLEQPSGQNRRFTKKRDKKIENEKEKKRKNRRNRKKVDPKKNQKKRRYSPQRRRSEKRGDTRIEHKKRCETQFNTKNVFENPEFCFEERRSKKATQITKRLFRTKVFFVQKVGKNRKLEMQKTTKKVQKQRRKHLYPEGWKNGTRKNMCSKKREQSEKGKRKKEMKKNKRSSKKKRRGRQIRGEKQEEKKT